MIFFNIFGKQNSNLKHKKMANMSYCRFQNTYTDLKDCYETLENKSLDELSEAEKIFAKKLIKLCRDIADEFLEEIK